MFSFLSLFLSTKGESKGGVPLYSTDRHRLQLSLYSLLIGCYNLIILYYQPKRKGEGLYPLVFTL